MNSFSLAMRSSITAISVVFKFIALLTSEILVSCAATREKSSLIFESIDVRMESKSALTRSALANVFRLCCLRTDLL